MSSALQPVRSIFRAVVCTVVPGAAEALDEKGWAEVEGLVEETLAPRPPAMLRQLRMLMRAVQWMPLVRYGRPFTKLNDARRTKVLGWLESQPLQLPRAGFWGLRTLALLGYYGRPTVAASLGYTPDARGWDALKERP